MIAFTYSCLEFDRENVKDSYLEAYACYTFMLLALFNFYTIQTIVTFWEQIYAFRDNYNFSTGYMICNVFFWNADRILKNVN